MPATSQPAQTALLFPFECQSSMPPDFLRLRYLQSAADDTPLHTPPPPTLRPLSFLAPSQEVPKEALTGRKDQAATVVMLFETGGFVILNNTKCFLLLSF